jgi:hypothetical protein
MINYRSASTWLALVLAGLGFVLLGCPGDDDDFPRGVPDDDDDTIVDDDDDSTIVQNDTPPVLEIVQTDPDLSEEPAIAGTLEVLFTIDDPDSGEVAVRVQYGVDGPDGLLMDATLVDELDAELLIEEGPPMDAAIGMFVWDSAADIPAASEAPVLRLCPTDAEGNEGVCVDVDFGEAVVINTDVNDLGAFCQPGHLEEMMWTGGEALIPLSDGNCLNYQKSDPPSPDDYSAQFLLVLVNPEGEDMTFTISSAIPPDDGDDDDDDDFVPDDDDSAADDDDDSAPPPAPPLQRAGVGPVLTQPVQGLLRPNRYTGNRPPPRAPAPMLTCEPDLTEADVHNDDLNFEFRSAIDQDGREARGANLWALGEHIAIYIDDETPIDWDEDCTDDTNPIEYSELPAFGFTNCDLNGIVSTFDDNIWPTLTTLFGEPSDVDNNCRVTVFLSHRLNRLTLTNSDESDDSRIVKSFTEPNIDLWKADLTLNPNSNEEEMLFLYAPDPVGFWSDQTVQLEDYLSYDVGGQIAVAMQDLISYAVHREVEKSLLDPAEPEDVDNPPAEEDWLNDAMGLLAADMTGFGSISYYDAWIYQDRSHLLSLQTDNTLQDFEDRGGQFLFARYMHDLMGDDFIWDIMHAENSDGIKTQGVDSIITVLGDYGLIEAAPGDDDDHGDDDDMPAGDGEAFIEFVRQWATALAISGRQNIAGGQLVPDTVVFNYTEPGFVSVADPANPLPGELYGANGYQQGFDVNGLNKTYEGGAEPGGSTELESMRVLTQNLDPLLFHPQTDFFGKVAPKYGIATVLVSGLEQPVNWIKIETANGSDLVGNVIRINDADPHVPLLTLEDVDGAKITTTRRLDNPAMPNGTIDALLIDGSERNVIGRIDDSEEVDLSVGEELPDLGDDDDDDAARDWYDDDDSAGEDATEASITDTDRYSFSLAGVTTLGIWVDRRIAKLTGDVELADPFLAIVPASDVPDAFDYTLWNFGPLPSHGPCADMSLYNYPVVMPDWLAAQANLISDPTATFDVELAAAGDGDWECLYDSDQDGIADVEEAKPTTLMGQILLRQAQNLWDDPTFYDATFGALAGFGDVSSPWWDDFMIDIDSNEQPDDEFATAIPAYNLGGRSAATGEEAVWMGTLPPGEYVIIVGGVGGGVGPYDLSVRLVQ